MTYKFIIIFLFILSYTDIVSARGGRNETQQSTTSAYISCDNNKNVLSTGTKNVENLQKDVNEIYNRQRCEKFLENKAMPFELDETGSKYEISFKEKCECLELGIKEQVLDRRISPMTKDDVLEVIDYLKEEEVTNMLNKSMLDINRFKHLKKLRSLSNNQHHSGHSDNHNHHKEIGTCESVSSVYKELKNRNNSCSEEVLGFIAKKTSKDFKYCKNNNCNSNDVFSILDKEMDRFVEEGYKNEGIESIERKHRILKNTVKIILKNMNKSNWDTSVLPNQIGNLSRFNSGHKRTKENEPGFGFLTKMIKYDPLLNVISKDIHKTIHFMNKLYKEFESSGIFTRDPKKIDQVLNHKIDDFFMDLLDNHTPQCPKVLSKIEKSCDKIANQNYSQIELSIDLDNEDKINSLIKRSKKNSLNLQKYLCFKKHQDNESVYFEDDDYAEKSKLFIDKKAGLLSQSFDIDIRSNEKLPFDTGNELLDSKGQSLVDMIKGSSKDLYDGINSRDPYFSQNNNDYNSKRDTSGSFLSRYINDKRNTKPNTIKNRNSTSAPTPEHAVEGSDLQSNPNEEITTLEVSENKASTLEKSHQEFNKNIENNKNDEEEVFAIEKNDDLNSKYKRSEYEKSKDKNKLNKSHHYQRKNKSIHSNKTNDVSAKKTVESKEAKSTKENDLKENELKEKVQDLEEGLKSKEDELNEKIKNLENETKEKEDEDQLEKSQKELEEIKTNIKDKKQELNSIKNEVPSNNNIVNPVPVEEKVIQGPLTSNPVSDQSANNIQNNKLPETNTQAGQISNTAVVNNSSIAPSASSENQVEQINKSLNKGLSSKQATQNTSNKTQSDSASNNHSEQELSLLKEVLIESNQNPESIVKYQDNLKEILKNYTGPIPNGENFYVLDKNPNGDQIKIKEISKEEYKKFYAKKVIKKKSLKKNKVKLEPKANRKRFKYEDLSNLLK